MEDDKNPDATNEVDDADSSDAERGDNEQPGSPVPPSRPGDVIIIK